MMFKVLIWSQLDHQTRECECWKEKNGFCVSLCVGARMSISAKVDTLLCLTCFTHSTPKTFFFSPHVFFKNSFPGTSLCIFFIISFLHVVGERSVGKWLAVEWCDLTIWLSWPAFAMCPIKSATVPMNNFISDRGAPKAIHQATTLCFCCFFNNRHLSIFQNDPLKTDPCYRFESEKNKIKRDLQAAYK